MLFYKEEALKIIDKKSFPSSGNLSSLVKEQHVAVLKKEQQTPLSNYDSARDAYEVGLNKGYDSSTSKKIDFVTESPDNKSKKSAQFSDDDMAFFDTLLQHTELVNGLSKLNMRIDLINIVKSFVFNTPIPSFNTQSSTHQFSKFVLDQEDVTNFRALIPYTSLVTGSLKMKMLALMMQLVKRYAYPEDENSDDSMLNIFL